MWPTSPAPSDWAACIVGEEAHLLGLESRSLGHREHVLARVELAVDDPHERDDAPVLVVGGVEDEGARRCLGVAAGRRNALDDRIEGRLDAFTGLRRHAQHAVGQVADELGQPGNRLRVGLREVDLVDEREQLSRSFSIAR